VKTRRPDRPPYFRVRECDGGRPRPEGPLPISGARGVTAAVSESASPASSPAR
jgi:hypothetical protein